MLANNYSINDKRYFQLLLPAHHYLYALTTLRYLTNKYDDFRLVGWLASCVSMLLCGLTKSCITLNRSRVRRSANKALTNENKKKILPRTNKPNNNNNNNRSEKGSLSSSRS